jgi:hypothetical protein
MRREKARNGFSKLKNKGAVVVKNNNDEVLEVLSTSSRYDT